MGGGLYFIYFIYFSHSSRLLTLHRYLLIRALSATSHQPQSALAAQFLAYAAVHPRRLSHRIRPLAHFPIQTHSDRCQSLQIKLFPYFFFFFLFLFLYFSDSRNLLNPTKPNVFPPFNVVFPSSRERERKRGKQARTGSSSAAALCGIDTHTTHTTHTPL